MGTGKSPSGAAARAAKVAAVRAEQKRRERRTRIILIAAVSAIVGGLIAAVAIVVAPEIAKRADLEAAVTEPITGVEEFKELSAAHVESTPEPVPAGAAVLPPVGGDHDPTWQNCGIYTEPVGTPNAVHSLEHGAVWVTYRPGLAQDQVGALTSLVEGESYALLSPFENLAAPVVLTAWGVQLELDRADDPRAAVFLAKYLQGEQTPEPGAACSGGIGAGA